MEGAFPRTTAKYPEIQKDVMEIDFSRSIRFRVSTIFDQEVYMNQYEISIEQIRHLDQLDDNISSHEIIFKDMVKALQEAVEKKKSDKVQYMVDQILKINPN